MLGWSQILGGHFGLPKNPQFAADTLPAARPLLETPPVSGISNKKIYSPSRRPRTPPSPSPSTKKKTSAKDFSPNLEAAGEGALWDSSLPDLRSSSRNHTFRAFLNLSQRAQRSKKFNLARNFQSRSKFLISLENFNLDVSISPQKIGPRWVARSKISFSLEIFNLARNLEFFDLWAGHLSRKRQKSRKRRKRQRQLRQLQTRS